MPVHVASNDVRWDLDVCAWLVQHMMTNDVDSFKINNMV